MPELKEKFEPEGYRHGRSRSNPLISIGGCFLLRNMGALENPKLHWEMMWRLWPLMLIFAGANVLVRQFPWPVASLLSAVAPLGA